MTILPHHETAASTWGQGGRAYDDISFAVSDALAHAARRLNATAGQQILDVATGTGWSARNAARRGAHVTAVDISDELLAAAAEFSAHGRPPISFRQGDAEALAFGDAASDGVISTFGVVFVANQDRAAAELGRVCRRGGRLAVAAWAPGGAVSEFFGIIARHAGAPPPPTSPLAWGDPAQAERPLGREWELTFEPGVSEAYHESVEDIWSWHLRGFGPMKQLGARLHPDRLQAFQRDVDAYHRHYQTPAGLLHVRREYLLIRGIRR